jgi:hypothetical protein
MTIGHRVQRLGPHFEYRLNLNDGVRQQSIDDILKKPGPQLKFGRSVDAASARDCRTPAIGSTPNVRSRKRYRAEIDVGVLSVSGANASYGRYRPRSWRRDH